jgi:tetratricopeptide (TPR) repeat protein
VPGTRSAPAVAPTTVGSATSLAPAAGSPTSVAPATVLDRGSRAEPARSHAPRPLPPPQSRLPLYLGAAALVLVAAAIGVVLQLQARARSRTAGADVAKQQVGVLTEALVATQLELARESLEHRDYRAAVAQAQEALRLDPERSEAKTVLDRANEALAQLDAAANEAQAAFDGGDMERSSRALARVLALDPRHPVVDRLSKELNSRFRFQAEEARRLMAEGRRDAERSRASDQPRFAQAAALVREADAAFANGEFAVATQKFLESRNGFEHARRTAEAIAQRTPPPPPPTLAAATVAPPPTQPLITLPAQTPPPATLPPATLPPPTLPASAAPSLAPSDEPAVRRLIEQYGDAIERKDLALFRSVKPSLSSEEEKRLRDAFKAIQSQQVNITITSVRIEGTQATVRVSRQDTINGKPVPQVQQVFRLAKGPAGWAIQSIGQ